MTRLAGNRLVRVFADARRAGRRVLVPFITAGLPDLETTLAILRDLERRGVRVCELGIPYSDPIADGPVIQASYTAALAGGVTGRRILAAVGEYRASGGTMALAAMVSASIIFRHGVEAYLRSLAQAGFDATIIPDMPLEEAGRIEPVAESVGLANVLLAAPTSPPRRQIEIARRSRGFLYFISVAGTTGQRDSLPPQTIAAVAELRRHVDTPICIGFGISSPDMVAQVCRVADGAIVGSAIVRRLAEAAALPRRELVERVGAFADELLSPLADQPG